MMRLCGFILLLGTTALLIGCSPKPKEPPEAERPLKADQAVPADVAAVAKGNNAFAVDVLQQLDGGGNLIFSPFSVSMALSMTYAGAKGETAKEMATVLHYPFEGERLHMGCAGLLGKLSEEEKPVGVQLSIANSLWGPFECNKDFLAVNRDCYAAHVRKIRLRAPRASSTSGLRNAPPSRSRMCSLLARSTTIAFWCWSTSSTSRACGSRRSRRRRRTTRSSASRRDRPCRRR